MPVPPRLRRRRRGGLNIRPGSGCDSRRADVRRRHLRADMQSAPTWFGASVTGAAGIATWRTRDARPYGRCIGRRRGEHASWRADVGICPYGAHSGQTHPLSPILYPLLSISYPLQLRRVGRARRRTQEIRSAEIPAKKSVRTAVLQFSLTFYKQSFTQAAYQR